MAGVGWSPLKNDLAWHKVVGKFIYIYIYILYITTRFYIFLLTGSLKIWCRWIFRILIPPDTINLVFWNYCVSLPSMPPTWDPLTIGVDVSRVQLRDSLSFTWLLLKCFKGELWPYLSTSFDPFVQSSMVPWLFF